jgi:uncharacterized membrane protein YsdA (DUF1294 family)
LSVFLLFILFYFTLSIITFCVYGIDKSAAKKARRRIPESRLHWLSLLGGWPGALLGQKVFRHKTIKARFRTIFWLTCLVNIILFAMVCCFVQVGLLQGFSDMRALFRGILKR